MNFKELLTKVRSEIDERGLDGFFLDADIKRWLNEGQKDIARKTLFLQTYKFITNATGEEFGLPTDYIKLHKVTIEDNVIEHIDRNPEQGYVIWQKKIKFNFTIDDVKLGLYYYSFPVLMANDTDEPEVPIEYQDLLIKYAKYEAKLVDEDPNTANAFYQQYVGRLSDMSRDYGKQDKLTSFKVYRHKR